MVWAAILSSICFGLAHFVNLVHQSFIVTLQQVILVSAIGLMLCTVRILTNNMWLSVIMHIAFDVSPIMLTGDALEPWPQLLISFFWIGGISLLCVWAYNRHCLKKV